MLRVRFWGTRGSVPSPGPRTVRYGGNTPCVEVRTAGGTIVIFDAGTGIRALGDALREEFARDGAAGGSAALQLFLTHAHWDHIQGLPFFAPLYDGEMRLAVWGGSDIALTLERAVRHQMSQGVFPVHFDAIASRVCFGMVPDEGVPLDGVRITALPVRHPGGAAGFRVAADGRAALVYISDNELEVSAGYPDVPGWRDALLAFARNARLLVHDSTYTPAEYPPRRGWGHSRDEDAVRLAVEAGAERLLLFHHHPSRTDAELDARVEACRAMARALGSALQVDAAAEGMAIEL